LVLIFVIFIQFDSHFRFVSIRSLFSSNFGQFGPFD